MTNSNNIDQKIKEELSKLIPDTGEGQFFRELIFTHSKIDNWLDVANLIKKHFPDKTMDIDMICSQN